MTDEIFECGNGKETWEAMVAHLERRAAQSRSIGFDLEREAKDRREQAAFHQRDAWEFDNFARAMKRAPVTFSVSEGGIAEITQCKRCGAGAYDTPSIINGVCVDCDSDTRPKDGDAKQAPLAGSAGLNEASPDPSPNLSHGSLPMEDHNE